MQKFTQEYFKFKYLKESKVLFRHYQNNIFKNCKCKNSLVVLPTGLGKTIIGILLISNALEKYSMGKVLILAPTRPLVSQHKISCKKFLKIESEKILALTSRISPEKRRSLFKESQIIISTPQIIKNDVEKDRYDLKEVSLIIFDEAHRAKGNYAYTFISEEYINTCTDPHILGLTASPGKDELRIQDLCSNLFIENIVFKTYDDADVKDYIYNIDTFIERVKLPLKLLEISQVWQNLFSKFLRFFIERELINPYKKYYSKLDFLRITQDLTTSLRYEKSIEATEEEYLNLLFFQSPTIINIIKEKSLNIQSIFSYCSSCISILHAKELLETQDITLFSNFLERLQYRADSDILAAKRIVNSNHYKLINELISRNSANQLSHPKINRVLSIVNEELEEFNNRKILIFTQYREMAEKLKNVLKTKLKKKLNIEKFIGQSNKFDDYGYPQCKQIEILEDFRAGKIDILIATSVAEEGLDIPNVEAVIFYEPIPSEIRLIQRRGRTGRHTPGRCYILIADDTVDVPFYIVANRKECSMNSILLDPEDLILENNIKRKKINFTSNQVTESENNLLKDFKMRRKREKELLAERSIEDIISELENFCNSKEFEEFRKKGVNFLSDFINIGKERMKTKIIKIKGKKTEMKKRRKQYLNRNVKALINIVKFYNENGKLNFEKFQNLAKEEDIIDKKFYVHFYQACNLGFLQQIKDDVFLVNDYD
ncbi:MAG: DEAD/DEAH box helicase [Promethearchaeota archaeon]